ncbi:hypothetical protein [Xanthomonas albilineans]|uniref:hypothetical protein n=1 Tax=Xanthomonas albilineans TaxID=29447 RepID=UPI0005F3285A|nr:hypothetical protein [Xanthomonas albilineans]
MNTKTIKFAALFLLFGVSGYLLRICWIVHAWNMLVVAALLLGWSLIAMCKASRAARRSRLPADFVRPNTPDFPAQPRRDIR